MPMKIRVRWTLSVLLLAQCLLQPVAAQQPSLSINQQKSQILQEVYTNPDYLALIDIEKAQVTLQDLSRSFSKIEAQYKQYTKASVMIEWRYGTVQEQIEEILVATKRTEGEVMETMTKIALSKKIMQDLKKDIARVEMDINETKTDLEEYTLFLYTLSNQLYGRGRSINDVGLFVKADSIAESLSQNDMVQMLTKQLQVLIENMKEKQESYADSIKKINVARLVYYEESRWLQRDLDALEEQKSSLYELLSYIQSTKLVANSAVVSLGASQDSLKKEISTMQTITNSFSLQWLRNREDATPIATLKEMFDREDSDKYMTRPIIWKPNIRARYWDTYQQEITNEPFESLRFELPHQTELYASAPGIVYKVIDPKDMGLWWVILLHKHWYTTFYSPVNTVYVKQWDIVNRGQLIALSWGQPGTKWSGYASPGWRLDYSVMKNGQWVDPMSVLDVSIFPKKSDIPVKYADKYLKNLYEREVPLDTFDVMKGNTLSERRDSFLRTYARWAFADSALWVDAAAATGIDPVFGMCIWFAETSFKNFKTVNNIGNVWNDDRGRTRTFPSPLAGAKALFNVFNNQYLGKYDTMDQLSRFNNESGFIYASSPYNWQKNIMTCLSSVEGYRVPEDWPFRRVKKNSGKIWQ